MTQMIGHFTLEIHDENGKLAYLDRPYEIEAFKVQEELLEKFST